METPFEDVNINQLSVGNENSPDDLDIDTDSLHAQVELKNQRYKSDTASREWLSIWTASVVTIWLIGVICVLVYNSEYLHLSDAVLITLLGTTTFNIIGLSLIVLRGLFGNSKK